MSIPSKVARNVFVAKPDDIFKVSMEKFNSLPRTGKPSENEWTVLSCIVKSNSETGILTVIALGTGTKCIGGDLLCPKGLILNDSHAEVMARRGFLRYVYSETRKASRQEESIVEYDDHSKRYQLKAEINFHFFSSHAPCGDATIIEMVKNDDEPSAAKRTKVDPGDAAESTESFTGAKLLTTSETSDRMAQDAGALRLKPGRGVRTLSMSCSDKLSRWNVLGIQGALVDCLLKEPIYLRSFTFCGNVAKESVARAIYGRWREKDFDSARFSVQYPEVYLCSMRFVFPYVQQDGKNPAPTSVVWCSVDERSIEVAVSGKRQGVTKSKRDTLTSSLRISKAWLLHEFVTTVSSMNPSIAERLNLSLNELSSVSYKQIKHLSSDYQSAWSILKDEYFSTWTEKSPGLLDFKLDNAI